MNKKILAAIGIIFALTLGLMVFTAGADELDITVESSDGYSTEVITDDDAMTTDYYMKDTVLTIRSEQDISSVYIKWDTEPGGYNLTVNGKDTLCGQHNFLHEYIKLEETSKEVKITIPKDRVYVADVYAFSEGTLPDWVQIWDDPCEKADFLIFSAHSDDEILFMGSIAPTYLNKGDYSIQVAYYVDFTKEGVSGTEMYRRHELLDGLWTLGITHYPQFGEFADQYSRYSLEEAEALEDVDAATEYVVRTIRRFKPQVLVSHDEDGEYGHGQHIFLSKLVRDAIELAADDSKYTSSANMYGTWDVPKTYLHLYKENEIVIDARVPLSKYGGRTALEVAREAYSKHLSQQWMDFYVSDGLDDDGNPTDYEYSFARFGLYRSLVGPDTGNDMMENLTPYAQQQEEPETTEPESETETGTEEETTTAAAPERGEQKGPGTIVIILIIVAAVVVVFFAVLLIISAYKKKKRRERELARRRKIQKMREMNRKRQQ